MSESFTAIEYAVLVHLKAEGRCTIPAIAADLLLRPSEVETTLSALVTKNFAKKEGDFYLPGDVCLEAPLAREKKDTSGTSGFGFASFFLSASVFARNPNTLHVSSKEIKLIQVSLSPSASKQSQPLSRLRSVCNFEVPFG